MNKLLRSSREDQMSAAVSCLRSEVYHPVSSLDDIQIMFDDNDGVSFCKQGVERLEKFLDVIEMKSGSRLVKNEEYPLRL